ncbi:hypothetical protein GCM10027048_09250 [Hymenobacter coalescens]
MAGLAFGAELYWYTFGRNAAGPYWSPVWLLLSSLLLAVAACGYAAGYQLVWPSLRTVPRGRWLLAGGAVAASVAVSAPVVARTIARLPADGLVKTSDIVPTLWVYVERFLAGQTVYERIDLGTYSFLPNYPPMHWLPFVPAELLGVDYRWWAMGALWLGLLTYQLLLARQRLPWPEQLLKAVVPVLVVHFIVLIERPLVGQTVEGLVFGYYALLSAALLHRSVPARAVALVLCVLSRYSLALWLPLYAVLLWYESPRRALQTVLLAMGLALALLAAFLWHDPTIILRAQLENFDIARTEWAYPPLPGEDGPPQLFRGVGLMPWWYPGPDGALTEAIGRLQTWHFAVCTLVPLAFGAWWWPRRRRLDTRLVALCSLKAYLAVFYAFLIVPFAYLGVLSLVLSWFLLLLLRGGQSGPVLQPVPPAEKAA